MDQILADNSDHYGPKTDGHEYEKREDLDGGKIDLIDKYRADGAVIGPEVEHPGHDPEGEGKNVLKGTDGIQHGPAEVFEKQHHAFFSNYCVTQGQPRS
jgi:hypothetical protein